jgi:zinc protease
MLRPILHTALAAAILAGPASAQRATPRIEYETFTLANGMRFIVHEDRSTPIVAVNLYYDVGSAHEPPGRSGFAHLFEHMLFEETEHLEKGEQDRLLQQAGAQLNATTDTDRTLYYEVLPSNRLNLAMWIHAQRLALLKVTEENFQREREVVKEERRMRIDNAPYGQAILTADTLATDWLPYRHTVIGSMEDLEAASVEDVRAFYERFYTPNNATMVVAGDVSAAEVRALAEMYFGWIPRGPEPPALPPMPATPRTDGERRVTLADPLANLPLYLSVYGIPPHRNPDTYALELLASIFSVGESSRLQRRLVRDEQAALQVFAVLDSRVGPGRLMVGGLPNQGIGVERLEALIEEEIDRLTTGGVTARELEKAKNQVRAGMIRSRQTVQAKAEALQHARLMHGDLDTVNTDLDRYMAVTAEDILRVARTYLTRPNRTVVITVPAQPPS